MASWLAGSHCPPVPPPRPVELHGGWTPPSFSTYRELWATRLRDKGFHRAFQANQKCHDRFHFLNFLIGTKSPLTRLPYVRSRVLRSTFYLTALFPTPPTQPLRWRLQHQRRKSSNALEAPQHRRWASQSATPSPCCVRLTLHAAETLAPSSRQAHLPARPVGLSPSSVARLWEPITLYLGWARIGRKGHHIRCDAMTCDASHCQCADFLFFYFFFHPARVMCCFPHPSALFSPRGRLTI